MIAFCSNPLCFWETLYRKFHKYSDTQNICCNHPKSWTRWRFRKVMHPKDAEGIANSVDPDQTAPLGAVWSGSALFAQPDLSVRKLRKIRVVKPKENSDFSATSLIAAGAKQVLVTKSLVFTVIYRKTVDSFRGLSVRLWSKDSFLPIDSDQTRSPGILTAMRLNWQLWSFKRQTNKEFQYICFSV